MALGCLTTPNFASASDFIPAYNQSLKHRCEQGYLGKGVFNKAGEVLLCVNKTATERGWVLAPSKFVPEAKIKCSKAKQVKIILKIEYTCVKFSDGLKFVKTSTITSANNQTLDKTPTQSSPSPSVEPTAISTTTPSPSSTPTASPTSVKQGSGTGGGAGNGTGGGGGKGASPSPSSSS
jgi:hypothetical protein